MKAFFSFPCLGETSGNNFYPVLHHSIYRYIKLWRFVMTAACNNRVSVGFLLDAPQWLQLNIRKKSNTSYLVRSTCSYFSLQICLRLVPNTTGKMLTYLFLLTGAWHQQQQELHSTFQVISSAAEHLSMHSGSKTGRSMFITNATPILSWSCHSP